MQLITVVSYLVLYQAFAHHRAFAHWNTFLCALCASAYHALLKTHWKYSVY